MPFKEGVYFVGWKGVPHHLITVWMNVGFFPEPILMHGWQIGSSLLEAAMHVVVLHM